VTTSLGRLVRPGAHAGRGPVVTDAPAPSHDAPRSAGTARRVATEAVAAAVIATVTLLCLLQAPNAIAWALDGPAGVGTGAQGSTSTIAVLRAAGLALPAMAALAGIAALAVLRLRAWPVLLAGLLVMAVADALGGSARTVTVIAVVRVLHGAAAGLALPAALALAWERALAPRQWLIALWSVVAVAGLTAAPAVTRARLASGGWHAALAPDPWLTGAALTMAALYAVLAAGPGAAGPGGAGPGAAGSGGAPGYRARAGARPDATHARPDATHARQDATQERAQLAVLAVPGIGLGALSVAVTYRPPAALLAAGAVAVLILYGVAAVASADRLVGGPLCFPVIGAVTGLVVAPVAGAVTSLRALDPGSSGRLSWLPLAVTAGAAITGVAIALTFRERPRTVVLAGLVIAMEGLAATRLAGPYVPGVVLAGVSAPLAGGLAAAMTAALAEAGVASALSGVSLLVAGLLTGYLASGAVQVRMVTHLTVGPAELQAAERLALASAVGVWELAGLFSVFVALAVIFLTGRARRAGAASR
jgi:hypothetical protein